MTRAVLVLAAVVASLAGLGSVHAQGFAGDIMSGGMGFFGRGAGPIPRQTVYYPTNYAAGTIIINTAERRLYLVQPGGQALRYGIGVGRDGFRWSRPDLPGHMVGGIENPLGARALYLGSTLYRIHGSNEPETIGQAVSSGCFRMTNEDVVDLYNRVSIGATVVVRN